MENNIYQLRDLLSSMKKTLDKLLAIEHEKTAVLEKNSVDELNRIINDEQALIMEHSSLERERLELCGRLNAKTVSELYELYPDSKEVLGEIHEQLIQTVNEIKKVSSINKQLLETKRQLVRLIMSQLGYEKESTTYDKKAQLI